MKKIKTIDSFFEKKNVKDSSSQSNLLIENDSPNFETRPTKSPKIEISAKFDIQSLERDPGLRPPIWEYPIEKRDEVRRAYIKAGPFQCVLVEYPKSREKHSHSFQASWFKLFPSWLEYSPHLDAAFCLPCYLFHTKDGLYGLDAFTVNGFRTWNKVQDGTNCSFLTHIGKDLTSPHLKAEKACTSLINHQSHIIHNFKKFTSQEVAENRLRLKTSIEATRWLAFQGCYFRGYDESITSTNRGIFSDLLSLAGSFNEKVSEVFDKAPQNASCTSQKMQKQILHVLATKVKNVIREEIDDAKFCIIVDEARDESKKEQMSIVMRFVDKSGYVQERFLGLVHVKDTVASTLKDGIFSVLSHHCLDVQNIRGQGYDGASNMRGVWNGLQALIMGECRYAYYVHCYAHRLQLTLVIASKEVIYVHQFFTKMNSIINIVGASCKCNDQLKADHASNIAHLLEIDELDSGKWLNHIGSLQRADDIHWSSHLKFISSLMNMYSATCEVLLNIIEDGTTSAQRGDADAAYEDLTSFEFVFILHLMRKVLEISNMLCQALQPRSQDILSAMHLVSSTKSLLQDLRNDGWDELVADVKLFCQRANLLVPDFNAQYVARRGRALYQQDGITIGRHYKIDIFYVVIDSQLQELNNKFNGNTVELVTLSMTLDPREMRLSFKVDDICKLVEKFYPEDFDQYEILQLKQEFMHFDYVRQFPEFEDLTTISDLCQWLVKSRKSSIYPMLFRVVTLVLTLPVFKATTERSFSAMNLVKTTLRNEMEDEFFSDYLLVYIEKQIAKTFSIDSIVDDFCDM